MSISKYNAIRFILDEAYPDHEAKSTEWECWFRGVSRMFSYKIPDALLEGLAKKNDELRRLCTEYRERRIGRYTPSGESSTNKYERWRERQRIGNARAQQRRLEQEAEKIKLDRMFKAIEDQKKWESMKPVWDKTYVDIQMKRQEQLVSIMGELPPPK